MKKVLLTMLTLLAAGGMWAQTFSVPDTRVAPARQNALQITLGSSAQNRDLQFDLTLPEGITLVEDAATVIADGHVVAYNTLENGKIRFVVVDAMSEADESTEDMSGFGKEFADGVLATIPVLAPSPFTGDDRIATAEEIHISDAEGVDYKLTDISFKIIPNLLGDVNEDGAVDVQDIVTLISKIQGETPNPFNQGAADTYFDSVYDVQDITGIVGIIQETSGSSAAKQFVVEETELDPE